MTTTAPLSFQRRLKLAASRGSQRRLCRLQSSPSDTHGERGGLLLPTRRQATLWGIGLAWPGLLPAGKSIAAADSPPAAPTPVRSTYKYGFEERVQEFKLDNGMTFLVLERPQAPVVACHTLANVGAFEEEEGKTGIAHLLEHEAFKVCRKRFKRRN